MWPGVRSYESMPAPLKAGPVIVVVIIGGIVTVVTESAIRPSIARDFVLHGCACTPFAKQKPRAILSLFFGLCLKNIAKFNRLSHITKYFLARAF